MSSLKYHGTDCRLRAESHELKVKSDRILKLLTIHFALLATFFLTYSPSFCAEIGGPEVRLQNNWIHVTSSLALDEKYLQEIRNGVRKEIIFRVDLFRVWNMWPDEFIVGKYFVRTLKCDPVKMEYVSTSNDGSTRVRKRFQSLDSMMHWALTIDDLMLAHVKELEAGLYFVRVTVESKKRTLPPVLGYFMLFLPENEFKITKDSSFIMIGFDK
jgi:hypothetical protein